MNGPEHYAEAERLLAMLDGPDPGIATTEAAHAHAAIAQVHATLALGAPASLDSDWRHVAGALAAELDALRAERVK